MPRAFFTNFIRLHDVRMVQLRCETRLVEEHRREHRIAAEPCELDDEQLLESTRSLFAREIHVGHAALAEQRHESIATQRRLECSIERPTACAHHVLSVYL